MMVQITSVVLLSLAIVVGLIDAIPILTDWLGRIHIGRYQDREQWGQSISRLGVKWLRQTPKIKVTDNTRLVVIDMLRGNYTKNAIQHWQEAALLLGLSEQLQQAEDPVIHKEVMEYIDSKFDGNGQWKVLPQHVDVAILAYAVMKLDFITADKYKPALDYTWKLIKDHIGEEGTVLYRKTMPSYRYVDTIGFICPFLVAYGVKYNMDECIQLSVRQIRAYEQYGMLEHHDIPCHAYHIQSKLPLGLYGWGRGLGWYAIGLIDAWKELPQEHESKQELTESVKKFARAACAFQGDQGNWNWTVTRTESRPDSSTTATLAWFLLNASQIEEISQSCSQSVDLAIHYLMRVTRRNGAVDFSQGDTKDIGVYANLFNILPFTQGFCIRLNHTIRRHS